MLSSVLERRRYTNKYRVSVFVDGCFIDQRIFCGLHAGLLEHGVTETMGSYGTGTFSTSGVALVGVPVEGTMTEVGGEWLQPESASY